MKRWKQHIYKSCRNESKTILGYAIAKYGADSFIVETLCEVPENALDNTECYYAEQYESYVWQGGYNQTLCGRGRPYDYATKEETRKRMRESRLGTTMSDESKQKLSASMKGHTRGIGRIVSADSKAKNRASQPTLKLSQADAEYIRQNPEKVSQQALADKFNVSRSLIYLVVYGKAHQKLS